MPLRNKIKACCDDFTWVIQGTACAHNNLSVWSVLIGHNCINCHVGEVERMFTA